MRICLAKDVQTGETLYLDCKQFGWGNIRLVGNSEDSNKVFNFLKSKGLTLDKLPTRYTTITERIIDYILGAYKPETIQELKSKIEEILKIAIELNVTEDSLFKTETSVIEEIEDNTEVTELQEDITEIGEVSDLSDETNTESLYEGELETTPSLDTQASKLHEMVEVKEEEEEALTEKDEKADVEVVIISNDVADKIVEDIVKYFNPIVEKLLEEKKGDVSVLPQTTQGGVTQIVPEKHIDLNTKTILYLNLLTKLRGDIIADTLVKVIKKAVENEDSHIEQFLEKFFAEI